MIMNHRLPNKKVNQNKIKIKFKKCRFNEKNQKVLKNLTCGN